MHIEDLRTSAWRLNQRLKYIAQRGQILEGEYEATVREIIGRIKEEGDKALFEYIKRFDGLELDQDTVEIPYEELEKAYEEIDEETRQALEIAHDRIRRFHERQKENSFFVEEEGVILGMKVQPLERVGVYVPGGKAAYPSTVLMNVVPATVAGVEEVIMITPKPNPYTLAAAFICGVSRVFQVGGAHGVAALAFGTETIPKVDKIVGPGNIYVALAKKLLYGVVDIDMVAGPSEILIISDGSVREDWVAADLLSQAEHDELAGAFLITDKEEHAKKVVKAVYEMLKNLSRKEIAQKSIEKFGTVFLVEDLYQACQVANHIAPEHLEVLTEEPFKLLPYIKHAGAIFLGRYTPEALGDYILGPNHTLPTGGTARFFSPLGVYHFIKRSSVLYVTEEGFRDLSDHTKALAKAEGLEAHWLSVKIREES
ncbi:histidinol dehydrogenase [Thermocrinis minervae]|uniref:Histidinol dehydrogenase n=1 Tax=Thermocrinis minervae TaxID=381751 RepID=A0A1M6SWM0_9AQUI|nr:histidinol dehydrogenase [Thermocrinis minervae]SHK49094.1 histidinol dehydrogenase [Thermocrinis minervae]